MNIINGIVNIVYGTKRAVAKFQVAHPNERVIASSGVKAIKSTPKSEVDTGAQWIVSRRAIAILTNKRIKCGDWDIPLSSIKTAELINIKGLISKGQVLNISTFDNTGYQLGMQLNTDWLNSNHLKLEYLDKKIKTSAFSWIMRVALAIYLAYLIYKQLVN